MTNTTDRLIEIIEDHASMELAIRIIMETMETKELPPEGTLPCFNESIVEENFIAILKRITGKDY